MVRELREMRLIHGDVSLRGHSGKEVERPAPRICVEERAAEGAGDVLE